MIAKLRLLASSSSESGDFGRASAFMSIRLLQANLNLTVTPTVTQRRPP
jgi:hypothetical protein